MIWVFWGSLIGLICVVRKSQQPPPSYCVIEFEGKYWNGEKFQRFKKDGMTFKSVNIAWQYVDENFSERVIEDMSLEGIGMEEKENEI